MLYLALISTYLSIIVNFTLFAPYTVWFMLKTRGEDYFKNAVENAFAQVY